MFTTPCFIRKNTPELREKLRKLGYIISETLVITNFDEIVCYDNIAYGCEYPCEYRQKAIDCGTNEDLFIALAALRDDTDKNQWLTDGKIWGKFDEDSFLHPIQIINYLQSKGHKATIEEIIEHFKDK